jgi:RNAse (barnase) inhibitor barstar
MRERKILSTLSATNVIYYCDAAGNSDLSNHEEIKALVDKYGKDILPILIKNLSNPQKSNAIVSGENRIVSVGYVCFDLLCTITKATYDWYDIDRAGMDDGLWASVLADYKIPMTIDHNNIKEANQVQERWKALFDAGKVQLLKDYKSAFHRERIGNTE